MKWYRYLTLLLCFGCGVKQKSLNQTFASSHKQVTDQKEKLGYDSNTVWRWDSAGVTHKQWLRVYPRGEVRFSDGNFSGQLDSLLWYSSKTNNNKHEQRQQQARLSLEKQDYGELTTTKTKITQKEKHKLTLAWWVYLLPLLAIIVIGYRLRKRRSLQS